MHPYAHGNDLCITIWLHLGRPAVHYNLPKLAYCMKRSKRSMFHTTKLRVPTRIQTKNTKRGVL